MVEEVNAENFPSYTSIHGLKFTVRGNHPVRRVLWTLTILVTLGALFKEIYFSIEKISKKDSTIITRIQLNHLIRFPAVSICNMNAMKKSKIVGTDSQVFFDNIDLYFDQRKANQSFSSSFFDFEKAILENGHKLKYMLVKCLWDSQNCSEKNFTMFFSFRRGLCYTFNSGRPGHPLQFAKGPGRGHALELILNAEVDEYYGAFSYEGTGFKVLIHDQNDFPDMELNAFQVSAGFKFSYSMNKEKFLGIPGLTCHEQASQSSGVYSQIGCLAKCRMVKVMKKCKCRIFTANGIEELSGLPICNFVDNKVQMCVLLYSHAVRNSECECPLPCTREVYRGQPIVSTYVAPHFWQTYEENKNNGHLSKLMEHYDGIKKDSLTHLQIFYSSPEEKIRKEILVYDWSDLISDFGGFFGLFLGCSILTIGEFLDLLITWCQRSFHKDRITVIG